MNSSLRNFLFASVFIFLLAACDSSGVKGNLPSNSNNSTSPTPASAKTFLECSALKNQALNFNIIMTTYVDNPFQRTYIHDYGRIRFKTTPANLKGASTDYIKMFRWKVGLDGQPDYNQKPVQFYIQQRSTGMKLMVSTSNNKISYMGDVLSREVFKKIISINRLQGFGITVDNFLEQVLIVATGLEDLSYKALTFAVYKQGESSSHATGDILIPAFATDPNVYAKVQASPLLHKLHPLWHLKDQKMTEAQYLAEGNKNCL